MKIIKIPITEQNREVYWSRNKDKKAWEKLMSECPSMTSKEFWNNEWEEFDKDLKLTKLFAGMWRVARMTGLGLTGRYLCNRKTGIRYLFLEPGRPDVI